MQDITRRAEMLMSQNRFRDAVALLEPIVERARAAPLWSMLAVARVNSNQHDRAADAFIRAAQLDAEGGRAWLNAGALLIEIGRPRDAHDAAKRAIDMGFAPPEAHHVIGRALTGMGQQDEAEAAFRTAIALRPNFVQAHRELAQLIWMRTADIGKARAALDAAIAANPSDGVLRMLRTRVLVAAGGKDEAAREMSEMVAMTAPGPRREIAAAGVAFMEEDYAAAEAAAMRAAEMGGERGGVLSTLAIAQLGQGAGERLLQTADELIARDPYSQLAVAYRATALRLMDDPRGAEYRDYENLVRAYDIDVPPGWKTIEAYLADLQVALKQLHQFESHPFEQSVRHGSQTSQSLAQSKDPVIKSFFRAINRPITQYLQHLGQGADALRSRNSGRYAIKGAWSIWLKSGGFHLDHVHPAGWVSSACYIALPDAVNDQEGKQGWIRFGRPGTQPVGGLEAEHYVQPKLGRLVLFPAWMWHGTVPFNTDERRLTIAFDVQPA
jgi:uncharacterized protein (TIGR02466 family)